MTNNSYSAIKTATTLLILLFFSSNITFAHSGRTDANDCHTDNVINKPHCHKELLALATNTEITAEPSTTIEVTGTEEVKAETSENAEVTETEEIKAETSENAEVTETEEIKAETSENAEVEVTETEEIKAETSENAEVTETEEVKEDTSGNAEVAVEVKKESLEKIEVTEEVKDNTEVTEIVVENPAKTVAITVKESSPTTNPKLTYEEGIKEGIRQCKKDPASCGIVINQCARVPHPWTTPGYRYYPPRMWYPPFPPPRRY